MRKITFDSKTIEEIKNYISDGHTLQQTCNRFTLKYDTLKRIMRENNIEPFYVNKRREVVQVSSETIQHVCALYQCTNTRLHDICKECKLEYYQLQQILNDHFTLDQQNARKSRMYRNSKLGECNPMKGRLRENHFNYKGIISDGNGYLQMIKPDWYEGRKSSSYVFYHHVVMCEYLGIKSIPKGFVVHHIDGNPLNNDISNLALMTISAHSKFHAIQRNLCKVQRISINGVGNDNDSETPNSDCSCSCNCAESH